MSAPKKLAIVTGTSGGLGREIAARLLTEEYRVVGVSRRAVEVGVDGPFNSNSYSHISWDLGDIPSLKMLVSDIIQEFGKPYALINNAAIGLDGLLPTMHNSEITRLIETNITSPIILSKWISRVMLAERQGRIVNVSSIVSHTGYRGLSVYAATKSALEGFSRSLARDLGRRGVTVNWVAPGFLETEMTAGLNQTNLQRIESRSALIRFAKTTEVAGAVEFLLSEEAAGITGTGITVDAGSTA